MNGVSKITVTEDISLVNFKNISRDLSVASRIMTEFFEQGINIDMISQSAPTGETANVSFTIDSKDLVRTLSIVQRFRVQFPNVRPSVSSGCCKIQLYGEEMRTSEVVISRMSPVCSLTRRKAWAATPGRVRISSP